MEKRSDDSALDHSLAQASALVDDIQLLMQLVDERRSALRQTMRRIVDNLELAEAAQNPSVPPPDRHAERTGHWFPPVQHRTAAKQNWVTAACSHRFRTQRFG